jgi:uncharacterized membrane protein YccF (DUF307 family)
MVSINLRDIQLAMAICLFILGLIAFGIGIFILVFSTLGRDMRTLVATTAKLAQKGIAEEVAGLVGNVSNLLGAMNGLVHTASGIGLFMTIIGLGMMIASYYLILQIH